MKILGISGVDASQLCGRGGSKTERSKNKEKVTSWHRIDRTVLKQPWNETLPFYKLLTPIILLQHWSTLIGKVNIC